MASVTVKSQSINPQLLDSEIRSVFPAASGIKWDGAEVTVYFPADVSSEDASAIRAIIDEHDARQLTPDQEAVQERRTRLDRLRTENAAALDERAFEAAPELVRQLARRVAWLEQEMLSLTRQP